MRNHTTLVLGHFRDLQVLATAENAKSLGVPFVPWLPSLSIATNMFLMGSSGSAAFLRFVICTIVMLVYYLLFGLHATYDMAHLPPQPEAKLQQVDNEDDGKSNLQEAHVSFP